ncbi:hypothetical protein HUA75_41665 [Myxococcus sp. CA040A]|nr:hypothetical protein [Myxococcus sp. CA040A]
MTCPYCAPTRRRPAADPGATTDAAKNELTGRQREILRFIVDVRERRGYSPSVREIGQAFRITSTNGVNDHLKALVRKGCLDRDAMTARSLVPTATGLREAARHPLTTTEGAES